MRRQKIRKAQNGLITRDGSYSPGGAIDGSRFDSGRSRMGVLVRSWGFDSPYVALKPRGDPYRRYITGAIEISKHNNKG